MGTSGLLAERLGGRLTNPRSKRPSRQRQSSTMMSVLCQAQPHRPEQQVGLTLPLDTGTPWWELTGGSPCPCGSREERTLHQHSESPLVRRRKLSALPGRRLPRKAGPQHSDRLPFRKEYGSFLPEGRKVDPKAITVQEPKWPCGTAARHSGPLRCPLACLVRVSMVALCCGSLIPARARWLETTVVVRRRQRNSSMDRPVGAHQQAFLEDSSSFLFSPPPSYQISLISPHFHVMASWPRHVDSSLVFFDLFPS